MVGMMFFPDLVKSFIYFFIFRKIGYQVRFLTCFLAAFSPFLIAFILPFHMPVIISFILSIALQAFIINYYADIEFFPAGLAVIGIVEAIVYTIQELVIK
jgi:hypothetical protein